MASAVPFQYLAHLVTVPVHVGGTEARFVFDTGIGVTLVSRSLAGLEGIDGFLSIGHFRSTPVTVDYPAGVIVIEDEESLARRVKAGVPVQVHVELDGCSTSVFVSFDLPGGQPVTVEVDTGSDVLILDETAAEHLGVDLHGPGARREDGRDETGHGFTRYFATLPGPVRVTGAPGICQADPAVMFQKIIYDGLAGHAFLRNFAVTYDLPNARMIFAPG